MTQKYASGAFVFTRSRGLVPRRTPEEIVPLAQKHGFDDSIVPQYAGDRATISRAIQSNIAYATKEGFLLRPIKRSSSVVVYAVVRESSDGIEKVDHQQSDIIKWSSENADVVEGTHPIAHRVAATYAELRGKLVGEDWTGNVTSQLDQLGAVPFREDGRVYWLPPQSIDRARQLSAFLSEIGLVLVLAEVEGETKTVVQDIVNESVSDQLQHLQEEVDAFDGTQKPSTYSRRLDEYQRLRQKAILYRDSLGIGVEQAVTMLNELEARVGSMLELRRNTVVHRSGEANAKTPSKKEEKVSLTFAGSTFTQKNVIDGIHKFTSGDAAAISSIKALESMGLSNKWQDAGPYKVKLQNSGPKGEDVSIEIKAPSTAPLASGKAALRSLGISINN